VSIVDHVVAPRELTELLPRVLLVAQVRHGRAAGPGC
jgi:hypothetical protein